MEYSGYSSQGQNPNIQQQALPNASAVLILGIVSIVGCFCFGLIGLITGIIALVLAKKDMQLYFSNPEAFTQASYKNLTTGRICAIIGLSISIISSIYLLIMIYKFGMPFFQSMMF